MENTENKTQGIWIVIGILIVIAIILIVTLKKPGTNSASGEPIKIGFIGPLTGDASSLGTVARQSVELAAEEVNANGGIDGRPVEVIYEDGKCSPGAAVSAANKLISADKVSAIVGGLCSSETSAFVATAMSNAVPVMSYCSSAPTLTGAGKYFFRDYPSDAFQGKFAAEYMYNTLGIRKVAVVYHITDWGTGIKNVFGERFKALGGEIVVEEGLPQESRDYKSVLTKVKAAAPEYIYAPLYPEGSIVFVNQLNQLGLGFKVFGGDSWGDTKFHAEANGKADILYLEAKTDTGPEFVKKLQAKTGEVQVPMCAAQAYDAFNVFAEVIEDVGTDSEKIQNALRKIKYQGVSGPISFDSNGDIPTANYVVKRVQNGTAVEVK